jgi:hypothetical protein
LCQLIQRVVGVAFRNVDVAGEPLKLTVLLPCVAPNPLPVTVTCVPRGPIVGDTELIVFPGTVKVTRLLSTPFIVTLAGSVVAPEGAVARICVSLQLTIVPYQLLKLTPFPSLYRLHTSTVFRRLQRALGIRSHSTPCRYARIHARQYPQFENGSRATTTNARQKSRQVSERKTQRILPPPHLECRE